ncbi:MAG: hypothetical protein ABOK23_13665 [Candidatus Methanoperedens sp.]|nr:hypothetical protein [Candidatus Methanoperedens sp.]MCZ7396273.1 hypothetical protein [Candidatus Methanoperedens sp.]
MQDKCPKCGETLITRTIKKELGYGSIDYPISQECPKCHWSKDLTGAGDIVSKPQVQETKKKEVKPPAPPKAAPPKAAPPTAQPKPLPSANINKIITIALAILVLGGIVWAFYLYPASQKQTSVTTPAATPTVTQTPAQPTGTPVPEVTPTGVIVGIKLDRYRGFFSLIDSTLNIKTGDNVIWTNEGSDALTLVSSDGLFEDRFLNNGKRTNYIFLKSGTYNFYLKENKNLNGSIIVES